jgi:serine/threonine protein kinase
MFPSLPFRFLPVLLCYNLTLSLFSHPLLILFIEQSIQLITKQ